MNLLYKLLDRTMFGRHRLALPLQIVVQHLIRGPREATFTLDDYPFHCSTAEKYWFERENYEQDMWEQLNAEVRPTDIVYDTGAHIGYWAVRLSRLCQKVVALEPSPASFFRLSDNVAAIPNVVALNVAAAATNGELGFTDNGTMSTVGKGPLTVRGVTLAALSVQYGDPDILIVDVEGFASDVMAGASGLRPRVICLELHNDREREAAEKFGDADIPRQPYPFRVVLKR